MEIEKSTVLKNLHDVSCDNLEELKLIKYLGVVKLISGYQLEVHWESSDGFGGQRKGAPWSKSISRDCFNPCSSVGWK